MSDRNHLRFINPQEGLREYIGRPGRGRTDEEEIEKDYTKMAEQFANASNRFRESQSRRHSLRTLDVPNHFDVIEIEFQGYFDQSFESSYYKDFGLALVHLTKFNRIGLFAIEDEAKFQYLLDEIQVFIDNVKNERENEFNNRIKYFKDFRLHSTDGMKRNLQDYTLIQLLLHKNILIERHRYNPQKDSLIRYLSDLGAGISNYEGIIEITGLSEETLNNILDNYDIILAACSSTGVLIRPGKFNVAERTFGFEINTEDLNDLPIVGIIDSGINRGTPLDPLLIDVGEDYDLTGSNPYIDTLNHGTGIASLTALGKDPIPDYNGTYNPACRLLSIKIINTSQGFLSPLNICRAIRRAYEEHGVKLFTLTVGYNDSPLNDNEELSSYARLLDDLTHELDILIIICTTNNTDYLDYDTNYLEIFHDNNSNIAPPADSLNNLTVGSISDNLESGERISCFTPFKECPSSYTRKLHFDWDNEEIFNQTNINNRLRKPDILVPGGEYEIYDEPIPGLDPGGRYGISVISADLQKGRSFKCLGSSLSTGLAANIAARIITQYGELDMQTVKALLINSSSIPNYGNLFDTFTNKMKNRVFGYGILNEERALYSSSDRVTMILEDEIEIEHIKSYPIHLPSYLNRVTRRNGLLTITASLCFKFLPKPDNQLLYCPVHIGFLIGKNLPLERSHIDSYLDRNGNTRTRTVHEGLNGNSSRDLKINSGASGWSQDYYYRAKIFSNNQKVEFKVARDHLMSEDNCFKIAIACDFHKLLHENHRGPYRRSHPYSLVLTIEQNPPRNQSYPDLYNEIQLINELIPLVEIDIELDAS